MDFAPSIRTSDLYTLLCNPYLRRKAHKGILLKAPSAFLIYLDSFLLSLPLRVITLSIKPYSIALSAVMKLSRSVSL